jgi:hypothetical protein
MKQFFKPEDRGLKRGVTTRQSHAAARLRLINEKEGSSPRAILAFSALGVTTWLKKKVRALAIRSKAARAKSPMPVLTTSPSSWRSTKDPKSSL